MFKLNRVWGLIFLGLLLVGAFFALTFDLGQTALIDYDEATYAQVVKESLRAGNYFDFTYFGNHWFEKPPLYFWLAALSAKIIGLNEFALRLPAVLFGWLAVLVVWLFIFYASKNYWLAFLGGLLLLLNGEFLFAARQVRMDVPVATAIIAGVYFFIRGEEKRYFYLFFGLALAAGVLLKSAIGFLALPLILIFSLVYRRWSWLKDVYFWLGLLLAGAIIAPWHIMESLRFGQAFWANYFSFHIWSRFWQPVIGQGVTVWHYFKFLIYYVEPWFWLFISAAIWQLFWWRSEGDDRQRSAKAALISVIFIFLFFAMARTKLFYYLEPVYPFLAIFLALTWSDFMARAAARLQSLTPPFFLSLFLLIGATSTVWHVFFVRDDLAGQFAIANEERAVGQYVAAHDEAGEKIYTTDWLWFETLRFYSGRPIEVILPDQASQEVRYLVASAEGLKYYPFPTGLKERSKAVYQGESIMLFEVSPAE